MNVLIVYSSAQGSTESIAARIGNRLREHGLAVTVSAAGAAPDPAAFDAVVLGSAIHSGGWLRPMKDYVDRYREPLRTLRPWLFSVSTLGDESSHMPGPVARTLRRMQPVPRAVPPLIQSLRAREHHSFAGVVHREDWGWLGAAFLWAMGGRHGDRRDWKAIEAWSDRIATELARPETGV